jgi:hypothetical protein
VLEAVKAMANGAAPLSFSAALLVLAAGGCSKTEPVGMPTVAHAPEPSTARATPVPERLPIADAASAGPRHPTWAACENDADCTYVSLGCCDTTPVNRSHAVEAQRELDASGRPHCAPKTACGPSKDGTWAGAPGKCRAGSCAMPDPMP